MHGLRQYSRDRGLGHSVGHAPSCQPGLLKENGGQVMFVSCTQTSLGRSRLHNLGPSIMCIYAQLLN